MEKKTRQVCLGAFFGFNLHLEVPKDLKDTTDEWFRQKFMDYLESERQMAVMNYRDDQFFKRLDRESCVWKAIKKLLKK
jgi:hypothetical protein